MIDAYLVYCRPGFEKEAVAELNADALRAGWQGHTRANADSGFALFCGHDLPASGAEAPGWRDLVFARQLVFLPSASPLRLPPEDRITPLVNALAGGRYRDLRLECPDTNDGKGLAGLLKALTPPLKSVLDKRGILRRKAEQDLHLFFADAATVYAGFSTPDNASAWLNGIPRLRFPTGAPSRSTLKLEEAFGYFLDETTQAEWLREGLTAVDLGAAPGGWTWQLVKRGLQVTAIDNGPMDKQLMATGQVEHLRVDGFRYRPARKVNWLVCDMIESPLKVAGTIAAWIADGDAQRAIFNLKLPMKKRFEELQLCRNLITETLEKTGLAYELAFKQLYHDREEVTGYLARR